MVTLRPRNKAAKPAATSAASASKPSKKHKKATTTPKVKPASQPESSLDKSSSIKGTDDAVLHEFLTTKVPDHTTKHDDIRQLHALIRSRAADLAPELQGKSTLAYGGFDYETKSKCSGRWSRIAIMVNKTGLSLMVSGAKDGKYLLESYQKKDFGKVASMGKSCLRFTKLSHLRVEMVEKLIVEAAKADVSSIAV